MLWADIVTDDMQREQAALIVPVQCGECCGFGCPSCSWTGLAVDHVACPCCDGTGMLGWFEDTTGPCGYCEGAGRTTEADAELFYALMMEEAV